MTARDAAPPITLPAITVILLAELLTQLGEFLRSGPVVAGNLEDFLTRRGHTCPGFPACNLIDDVSFTAAHLRAITNGIDKTAAEYARMSDYFGEDFAQD